MEAGWGDQLGNGLRREEQAGGLHSHHKVAQLDPPTDGGQELREEVDTNGKLKDADDRSALCSIRAFNIDGIVAAGITSNKSSSSSCS